MEKKNYLELDILREERDLGRRGYSYVVMYDGKEWRVPMFSFQIGGECPAKVKCVFKNNEMVQDTQVVAEKYYRVGSTYLFTIKKKWPLYKYYELQDRNVNEKGFKIYLRFSDSRDDLREGQQVECIVNEIRDGKPFLTLTDANPSCMEFKSKEEIFKSGGTAFTAWIDEIFKAPFLGEAARLHGEGDGKWVCLFSKEIETVIYSLIVSDNGDKAEFDKSGEWTEVRCRQTGVPAQIVPAAIAEYVKTTYPDAQILQIERDSRGWEIKLSNRWEITFDKQMRVVDIDD